MVMHFSCVALQIRSNSHKVCTDVGHTSSERRFLFSPLETGSSSRRLSKGAPGLGAIGGGSGCLNGMWLIAGAEDFLAGAFFRGRVDVFPPFLDILLCDLRKKLGH